MFVTITNQTAMLTSNVVSTATCSFSIRRASDLTNVFEYFYDITSSLPASVVGIMTSISEPHSPWQ